MGVGEHEVVCFVCCHVLWRGRSTLLWNVTCTDEDTARCAGTANRRAVRPRAASHRARPGVCAAANGTTDFPPSLLLLTHALSTPSFPP
eukprot:2235348-Rhodomonas_salina.3